MTIHELAVRVAREVRLSLAREENTALRWKLLQAEARLEVLEGELAATRNDPGHAGCRNVEEQLRAALDAEQLPIREAVQAFQERAVDAIRERARGAYNDLEEALEQAADVVASMPLGAQPEPTIAETMRELATIAPELADIRPEDLSAIRNGYFSAEEMAADMANAPDWRDIETAPKDGSLILVAIRDGGEPALVSFDDSQGRAEHHFVWATPDGSVLYRTDALTHWLPIPPLPAAPKAEETSE